MPQLLKTTEEAKDGHYHIAYILDDGTGITTMQDNHAHAIKPIIIPNPVGVDEMGQPILVPTIAGFTVEQNDGHSHELLEYPVKISDEKTDKSESVKRVLEKYDYAKRLEDNSIQAGKEAERFYRGEQWDEDITQNLVATDRAAETINRIEEKVDSLTGYQRQNRTDFKALPVEGGDQRGADIINQILKNISEQCFYYREESKVVEDSIITGRGLFHLYIDFDEDINGKINVDKFIWDNCYFLPHEKEDLSDCDGIIKYKWYSKEKIEELYPDVFDELSPEYKEDTIKSGLSEDWDQRLRTEEFTQGTMYKLIELEEKHYKRVMVLINKRDGFFFNAEGWASKDIESVRKTIPGFIRIPRTSYRIKVTRIASDKFLEEYYVDDKDFSILPLYAKKRNESFWGKIKSVIGLQRLINKAYSQFSDIINKVVTYGWFYDNETFANKKEEKKFIESASSPGFLAKLNDIGRMPQRVEGVKFPGELVNAIGLFSQSIREIMNVNVELSGISQEANQSGIAIKQKIIQQLIGSEYIFDNLSFAKKKLVRMIINKIQKLYTPQRMMRLLVSQYSKTPFNVGDIPFAEYTEEEMSSILNNLDLTKYDFEISESPYSPSFRMSIFLMLSELGGKGYNIPVQTLFEYSPIPEDIKQKIMQTINKQMQQQQETENQKYQTEIAKTLISKGIMPNMMQNQPNQTMNLPGT